MTPDKSFCSVEKISQDPAGFLHCPKLDDESLCASDGKCKWYAVATPAPCAPPADMPAPMCELGQGSSTPTDVVSAWSDSICSFKCPAGAEFKRQPMFTYPYCHPNDA
jgi:hypothetical protein